MDIRLKGQAYSHAMDFESIYNYSEQYKISGNPTVWKFMDLKKFESLIENQASFFAKPTAFIDPLEGSYSNWDILRKQKYLIMNGKKKWMNSKKSHIIFHLRLEI